MTAPRHPTPAERLLALLEDEPALEALPAEEVRAGLAAVGLDPARCVAFARALAGGTGSPGGRLLGAIDLADDEDEIARLESADIEAVRAQIPQGSAAAIAAEARRQAGGESNVVAIKPRPRSRILRWGGPAAGIAASLLVVAVVGVQLLDSSRQVTSVDLQPSLMSPQADAPAEPASRADEAPAPVARYAAPEAEKRKRSVGAEGVGATDQFAKQEREAAEMQAPAAPSTGLAGNLNEELTLSDRDKDDAAALPGARTSPGDARSTAEGFATQPEADAKASGPDMAAAIAAMVIVDPSQVPLAVQSQALPQPELAARIDEARRLAGDRPVIALYRVAGPAGSQDFAQVPLEIAMTQQMPAPLPLTRLLGPAAFEYDFLALPAP